MPTSQRSTATIVGAGIGGLATALALTQAGWRVTVLERAPELREIGAGLTLWPNGVQALRALGVNPRGQLLPLRKLVIKSWRGRTLIETSCDDHQIRYGAVPLPLHRADLQQMLLAGLKPESIKLGVRVTRYVEDPEHVVAVAADGRTWPAHLLVGADGVRSTIRKQLLSDGDPRYVGITIWRGVTEAPAAIPSVESWTFLGPGTEFGFMPMVDERVYWFASKEAPPDERPRPEGHRAELRQRYARWPRPVGDLIEGTPEEEIVRTDIFDRPPPSDGLATG